MRRRGRRRRGDHGAFKSTSLGPGFVYRENVGWVQ